jgi:hypothetical protein
MESSGKSLDLARHDGNGVEEARDIFQRKNCASFGWQVGSC